jgi:hypothetical protein
LARQAPPLGEYQFLARFDVMLMQHVTFEPDDFGVFFALDGYRHVGRNWYIGGETGGGGSMGVIALSI